MASLLSASSVDLTWYSTEEAIKCPNLPLRNYVVLGNALKYIVDHAEQVCWVNPPAQERVIQQSQEALKWIPDAKSGNLEACQHILNAMCFVWNELHPTDPIKYSPPASAVTSDLLEEDYTPTEKAFRPLVRWALHKAMICLDRTDKRQYMLRKELKVALKQVSGSCPALGQSILKLLCAGRLYSVLCQHLFDYQAPHHSTLYSTQPDSDFLDVLVKASYLNFKKNMQDSVKSMMSDETPFYESIHSNIISAFLAASARQTKVDDVVKQLCKFSEFDADNMYPYDLEDAMLCWMNLCLSAARSHPQLEKLVMDYEEDEFEDFGKDVQGGWMFCILLLYYYPDLIDAKVDVSAKKQEENFKTLEKLLEKLGLNVWVAWLVDDMSETNALFSNPGVFCWLYIDFLCDLLKQLNKPKKKSRSKSSLNDAGELTHESRLMPVVEPLIGAEADRLETYFVDDSQLLDNTKDLIRLEVDPMDETVENAEDVYPKETSDEKVDSINADGEVDCKEISDEKVDPINAADEIDSKENSDEKSQLPPLGRNMIFSSSQLVLPRIEPEAPLNRSSASLRYTSSNLVLPRIGLETPQAPRDSAIDLIGQESKALFVAPPPNEHAVGEDTGKLEDSDDQGVLSLQVEQELAKNEIDDPVEVEFTKNEMDDSVEVELAKNEIDDSVEVEFTKKEIDDSVEVELAKKEIDDSELAKKEIDDPVVKAKQEIHIPVAKAKEEIDDPAKVELAKEEIVYKSDRARESVQIEPAEKKRMHQQENDQPLASVVENFMQSDMDEFKDKAMFELETISSMSDQNHGRSRPISGTQSEPKEKSFPLSYDLDRPRSSHFSAQDKGKTSRPISGNVISVSLADLSENMDPTSLFQTPLVKSAPQLPQIESKRPKTGLQSFPLPETEEEIQKAQESKNSEEIWDNIQAQKALKDGIRKSRPSLTSKDVVPCFYPRKDDLKWN